MKIHVKIFLSSAILASFCAYFADAGTVLGWVNPVGLHQRPGHALPAAHVPFSWGKKLIPWRIRIGTHGDLHMP